jgi:hypothetical protein
VPLATRSCFGLADACVARGHTASLRTSAWLLGDSLRRWALRGSAKVEFLQFKAAFGLCIAPCGRPGAPKPYTRFRDSRLSMADRRNLDMGLCEPGASGFVALPVPLGSDNAGFVLAAASRGTP